MTQAKRELHGMSFVNGERTPLHRLWLNIRNRCHNPNNPNYKYYGGRGIKVCRRWDRFVNFAADVGDHPGKGWTLDRIDNNRDYKPSNVRWATRKTQGRNRNYCVLNAATAAEIRVRYGPYMRGRRRRAALSQEALAREYGVSQVMISKVIRGVAWS